MFIQVITGTTSDPEGIRRQRERWIEEVRPGAVGFLGSTGGVTADGTCVIMARFESAGAARANADRTEQSGWWSETEKYFDGEAAFADSEDVDTFYGGGSDAAGFVQLIRGRCTDRARAEAIEARVMGRLREVRPELLGILRAWHGDTFTEACYFTDEAAAREGEERAMPEDLVADLGEYSSLFQEMEYLDIAEPWLL
jgi:hypothetical protein